MTDVDVDEAAKAIVDGRLAHRPLRPLDEALRPRDLAAGYRVQARAHALLAEAGLGAIVGYKVGCTTDVMQRFLGIDSPCSGGILATSVHHIAGEVELANFVRLGVECEIAVHLRDDLPRHKEHCTRIEAGEAVGSCMAAIEIVDDRYHDYASLGSPTLTADDFFGAGAVLGTPRDDIEPERLHQAVASLYVDGTCRGTGSGSDLMGDPLEVLAWLANDLAQRGQGLRAGEFVLLGSVVQTQWLDGVAEVMVSSDALGEVRLRVTGNSNHTG